MAKTSGGETIIAQGVKLEGNFVSDGNVIIEGDVEGTVEAAGDLKIGEQAHISADVTASNAVVAGSIDGNIRINGRLELLPSSRISGDLSAQVLMVAPGSQINGTIRMGEGAGEGKKSKKSEPAE